MLTTSQVARRLGVKPQTIYAYVSRGLLTRTIADDARASLFVASEVEELARKGRPRQRARVGGVEVSLATSITEILPDRLSFRGHDATELVQHAFESVAELLWNGELLDVRWHAPDVRKVAALFPDSCRGVERFAAVTAVLAAQHPLRVDLSTSNVVALARTLISAFVYSLPQKVNCKRTGSLASQLWSRLSPLSVTPRRTHALNAALVLLADHELATSTVAVRVAASTRADPCAVVLAGLGALAGPLHGKAATQLHRLMLAVSKEKVEEAAARALSDANTLTGFGHPVYRDGDPRAQALLALIDTKRDVIDAVADAGLRKTGNPPNIDFALAALAFASEMPAGASEAIFAIARTAGFIAHALEEYGEQPLRFRARAIFEG